MGKKIVWVLVIGLLTVIASSSSYLAWSISSERRDRDKAKATALSKEAKEAEQYDSACGLAKFQIGSLEEGCKSYMVKYGGNPPTSLMELVQPTNGDKPLVEGGATSLDSPFGTQYQLDTDHVDKKGHPDPIVFVVLPNGLKLFSSKRASEGVR